MEHFEKLGKKLQMKEQNNIEIDKKEQEDFISEMMNVLDEMIDERAMEEDMENTKIMYESFERKYETDKLSIIPICRLMSLYEYLLNLLNKMESAIKNQTGLDQLYDEYSWLNMEIKHSVEEYRKRNMQYDPNYEWNEYENEIRSIIEISKNSIAEIRKHYPETTGEDRRAIIEESDRLFELNDCMWNYFFDKMNEKK